MSAALAALLAMTFSAERSVQAAAGGRVEALVGVVPSNPLDVSQAQAAVAIVPVAGLHVRRESYDLTALYRPRLFWRLPNRLNLARPLLLHQGTLQHRVLWSDRVALDSRLGLSIGEVDYALSSFVFDPTQPTVPNDEVTSLVRVHGSSTLRYAVSRRWGSGLSLLGAYNAPLDGDTTGFGTSAVAELEPFLAHRVDDRNELTLSVGVGASWFSTGLRETSLLGTPAEDSGDSTYSVISPRLRLNHVFSRQTEGAVAFGYVDLRVLQGSELLGTEQGERHATPTADVQMQSRVWQERGKSLSAGAFATYRWFFDPILGRPVRRIGGGTFAMLDLPPDWAAAANLSFFTTLGDDFEPPEFLADRRFDQTMLRIDVPVSYAVSRYLGVEVGVRSNLRGPSWSEGVVLDRVELWAYGALRFVFDPRDMEAGWAR